MNNMKTMAGIILCYLFSLANLLAQKVEAPTLEFVCELKVTTAKAMDVGETGHGIRRVIPITGGTFEGPKLKGEVVSGGADWQLIKENSRVTDVEAHYTIKTDDGVYIYVKNVGVIVMPADKPGQGQALDWTKIYFRAVPRFDAPEGKYSWMNNAIYVCKGVPMPGYVSIQVWKVL